KIVVRLKVVLRFFLRKRNKIELLVYRRNLNRLQNVIPKENDENSLRYQNGTLENEEFLRSQIVTLKAKE
ncbi:MAG: hypothetical protein K8R41_01385, partial [Bacteroidales bacterium]|nr:hypothetical protein [Bacteroidales bacterium]